tara:strand:+ start:1471 stop:3537 length:2067 start_codon:yes stop_codon:yes gene_type:complete
MSGYIMPPRRTPSDFAKGRITQDELLRVAIANDSNISRARQALRTGNVEQLTPVQSESPSELLENTARQEADARQNLERLGFRSQEAASIVSQLDKDEKEGFNRAYPQIKKDVMDRYDVKLLTPTFFLEYLRQYLTVLLASRGVKYATGGTGAGNSNEELVNTTEELFGVIPNREQVGILIDAANRNGASVDVREALSNIQRNIPTAEDFTNMSMEHKMLAIQERLDILRAVPSRNQTQTIIDQMRNHSRGEILNDLYQFSTSVLDMGEDTVLDPSNWGVEESDYDGDSDDEAEGTYSRSSGASSSLLNRGFRNDDSTIVEGSDDEEVSRVIPKPPTRQISNNSTDITNELMQQQKDRLRTVPSDERGDREEKEDTRGDRTANQIQQEQILEEIRRGRSNIGEEIPDFDSPVRDRLNYITPDAPETPKILTSRAQLLTAPIYKLGETYLYYYNRGEIGRLMDTKRDIPIERTSQITKSREIAERGGRASGKVYIGDTNIIDLLEGALPQLGAGIRRRTQKMATSMPRMKVGRGISVKQVPSYREFGKYAIHMPQLEQQDILNVKYKSLGQIPKFKPVAVSDVFRDFLLDLIETGKINKRTYNSIDENERCLFEEMSIGAGIWNSLGLKRTTTNKDEQDEKQFELLKGEYVAGNNNPQVLAELRRLVIKFMNSGRIRKQQGLDLLVELS